MDSSDIIAICAAVIALSATGISIWQGYLTRAHFRLSVKPHITITWLNFHDKPISFTMCNDGLGPAFIKSLALEVDGNLIETIGPILYKDAINKLGLADCDYASYNLTIGEAYSVGKNLVLLEFNEPTEKFSKISNVLPRLKFKIVYTSIYNEEEYSYYGNC